jgi:hypothetical protein
MYNWVSGCYNTHLRARSIRSKWCLSLRPLMKCCLTSSTRCRRKTNAVLLLTSAAESQGWPRYIGAGRSHSSSWESNPNSLVNQLSLIAVLYDLPGSYWMYINHSSVYMATYELPVPDLVEMVSVAAGSRCSATLCVNCGGRGVQCTECGWRKRLLNF